MMSFQICVQLQKCQSPPSLFLSLIKPVPGHVGFTYSLTETESEGSHFCHWFGSSKISGPRSLQCSWPFSHCLQGPDSKFVFQAWGKREWKTQKAQHLWQENNVSRNPILRFMHHWPKFYHMASPRYQRGLEMYWFFFKLDILPPSKNLVSKAGWKMEMG